MQIYVAESVEMCLYRLSGTTIGAILSVLVLFDIPQNSIFIEVALFMTIGICSLGSLPRNYHFSSTERN